MQLLLFTLFIVTRQRPSVVLSCPSSYQWWHMAGAWRRPRTRGRLQTPRGSRAAAPARSAGPWRRPTPTHGSPHAAETAEKNKTNIYLKFMCQGFTFSYTCKCKKLMGQAVTFSIFQSLDTANNKKLQISSCRWCSQYKTSCKNFLLCTFL